MDQFRSYVQLVFNNWTALQLAVEHAMGGANSYENALGLITDTTTIFEGPEIAKYDEYDFSDYLSEELERRFNTICEDDSPDQVAGALFRIYSAITLGHSDVLEGELKSLSMDRQWLTFKAPTNVNQVNGNATKNLPTCSGDAEKMDESEDPGSKVRTPEDEEWTEVKNKKR